MPGDAAPSSGSGLYLKAGILAALLLALYFLLIYLNIVSCGHLHPVVCDVYYSVISGGKPKLLIISGQDGIGDPDYFYEILKGPRFSASVRMRELSVTSLPELLQYQMVIVERARTMKIADHRMFLDYANRGGKIVWIADAGTMATPDESGRNYFLAYGERKAGGSPSYIGPWARKAGSKQVSLDYMLGVEYLANYCELASDCGAGSLVGFMNFSDTGKRQVYGLSQQLPFYGDFSIVRPNENAYQSGLAYLDYGTSLVAKPPQGHFWLQGQSTNFGKEFPMMVSSGYGSRVLYYSFPPEYLVSEKMPLDPKTGKRIAYWGIIEDMYYGMLYR
ncbi:MAG: hypothetical protein HY544_00640 [Candidatus Diapherotrites archaeon]|uniref:DUF4350 domain-containing protein n=1 Tax=Candidatus Iainarchaeum sp. TaxID=3101447 RepID=A0A8T3YJZ6_9ARCH|nr:hypothetical protein [Candidatus Diapherotrites archaeon]